MSVNDRVKKLIDLETGGNKRAFATRIGVTASVIENIVGKRKSTPSYTIIEKISKIEKLNLNWLIKGEGEVYSDKLYLENKYKENRHYTKQKIESLIEELEFLVKGFNNIKDSL